MRISVCQLPNDTKGLNDAWTRLAAHTRSAQSDLVLLPEMPFFPWLAASDRPDPKRWQQSVEAHHQWIDRLFELGVAVVLGTQPVVRNGVCYNDGFVWSAQNGATRAHTKYYLPDEAGFWEATWYRRGEKAFETIRCGNACIGFLICTELWFSGHARTYGQKGAHIIVCPRATPAASADMWLVGGRSAAVVSGAYCISSNLTGPNGPDLDFGGMGWIIEPQAGGVLGTTSGQEPFITMELDLRLAERAKATYPRYVLD